METLTGEQMKIEFTRRSSRRNDMLVAFQREGQLTTKQLMYFGPGMSSRIKELKRKGHIIVSTYVRPGEWLYTYLGEKEDDGTNVNVID